MTVLEEARDAVAKAITKGASGDTTVSAEDLGKLAHAVSEMEHGPQGGAVNNFTDYHYTSDHTSRHEKPERPSGTGFGSGAVS